MTPDRYPCTTCPYLEECMSGADELEEDEELGEDEDDGAEEDA